MTPEQETRARDVFLDALALRTGERDAFAARACGDDPPVLDRVRRLLAADRPRPGSTAPAPPGARVRDGSGWTGGAPALIERGPAAPAVVAGRYEIGDVLDEGGFGVVHRARDLVVPRDVAIKFLPLAGDRHEASYLREVAVLGCIRTPGVVRILDFGVEGRSAYIVMALAAGKPFPGDGLAPGDARSFLARAASLLEVAGRLHAAGIFHRDLKPANVLVDSDGRVTVVDLGIAEDESDGNRHVGSGRFVGTPRYVAPERAAGTRATAAGDLYSIGVMLRESAGLAPTGCADRVPTAIELPPDVVTLLAELVSHSPDARPASAWLALERVTPHLAPAAPVAVAHLGASDAVARVVETLSQGRSIDIVGARGSGRTTVLLEVERRLQGLGYDVRRARLEPVADDPDGASAPGPALEALVGAGRIVLADDEDHLPADARFRLDELRRHGAVARVTDRTDGEHVRLLPLTEPSIRSIVRAPDRVFRGAEDVARILWRRTRGNPRALQREVARWCADGLARWDDGLVVAPADIARLRADTSLPAGMPGDSRSLRAPARDVWNLLTLAEMPVAAETLGALASLAAGAVEDALASLVELDVAERDGDARWCATVASPWLADVRAGTRMAWCTGLAASTTADSDGRLRLLAIAGEHTNACRSALSLARARIASGRLAEAASILDAALRVARRHAPHDLDLYADLLATLVDASIGLTTIQALHLAVYHAGLAPRRDRRIRAWVRILEAAIGLLRSSPERARLLFDSSRSLPSDDHVRAAHIVANAAARATGSRPTQRLAVVRAARWVRARPERDSRALLAAWIGWLRYDEGRFDAACRSHARSARLARRVRARVTASANGAVAALEAGDHDRARGLAAESLRVAEGLRDSMNAARAELLLRSADYRSGRSAAVDEDLVAAAAHLEPTPTRGLIELQEAATAWRGRRLARAAELARAARSTFELCAQATPALLATALAALCSGTGHDELRSELVARAGTLRPPGVAAQVAALAAAAMGRGAVPHTLRAAALAWAKTVADPEVRREILAPGEVRARLDDAVPLALHDVGGAT